ncbi:MAG: dGTPase [Methanolobus sp.]|uniref:deoxyguanosinetriphosphate triphosphohydrolase family protein n=1 Tax=Methanolobus sp. TaxID=1874737 RepID=UPI00258DF79A|nr:dNTP triphosphohydrolase [Methanolobus sp.]MDK2831390.1 dGTPase [Methanolobus sp.]
MKHKLKQEFQSSDRLNQEIEKKLPLTCKILDDIERSDFAKDRDRILFSRAFRRLQHKAQVFSNETGDHYRTRLTHTLEVSQIARSLARYLDADEDLVEAIAIGHDIGHTPFGHQGERVLDEVMSGEDQLGLIKYSLDFGGFKHNFNGLRVLDVVQSKFENQKGLNLSWQVLEGILKHTKVKRHKECENCGKCWDIKRFVDNPTLINRLSMEYKFSVTLEGQIVAIADEIAQRQHDIDDGLRNKGLGFQLNKLYDDIENIINSLISNSSQYRNVNKDLFEDLIELLARLRDNLVDNKNSSKLFKTDYLVRNIIEYFILDVVANSRIAFMEKSILTQDGERKILTTNVVDFSPLGKQLNKELEKVVKYQILNSYEVNKFDGKSRLIIRQLFKAFYTNPLQMPSYALDRLAKELKHNCKIKKIVLTTENDSISLDSIDFNKLSRSEVKILISSLKLENLNAYLEAPPKLKSILQTPENEHGINEEFYRVLKPINSLESDKIDTNMEKLLKSLVENHYAYLSTICDYIAGMSDNYAKNEYKKLYLVE